MSEPAPKSVSVVDTNDELLMEFGRMRMLLDEGDFNGFVDGLMRIETAGLKSMAEEDPAVRQDAAVEFYHSLQKVLSAAIDRCLQIPPKEDGDTMLTTYSEYQAGRPTYILQRTVVGHPEKSTKYGFTKPIPTALEDTRRALIGRSIAVMTQRIDTDGHTDYDDY